MTSSHINVPSQKFPVPKRTWQDAWSVSAHAQCRQLSSQILAKLFIFMNIFGVDSRLGDDPQLFYVLRDL